MRTVTIRNPEIDQEASALVTGVFEMMTPHWLVMLPAIEVVLSRQPFNRVPELLKFCELQNKEPGWRKYMWKSVQVVCPEFDEKGAVLWARYDRESMVSPADYYFQKKLFAVIANLMWSIPSGLREEVRRQATGIARDSDGAARLAFQDSFSRFFLNPSYLKERKEAAWAFMERLDKSLLQQHRSVH